MRANASCLVTAALLSMTAGSSAPEPGAIVATFDGRGSTSYTYTLPEGESSRHVIGWDGVDCREFSITATERTSTYLWNHGAIVERTPLGKAPCGEHGEPGHAYAVIKATVIGLLLTCEYRGTASGRGDPCEYAGVGFVGGGPTHP